MEKDDECFVVEGFLVGGDREKVQLVMPPYLLEIARTDLLRADERPALPLQNTDTCVAVRLELRHGARLLGMRSAAELEPLMWERRRPFAMTTRPPQPALVGETAYTERERRYFASIGMEV